MPDPLSITARDADEAALKTADERLKNAAQDFRALVSTLGPLYDSLTPQQRNTQITNWGDFQNLTDAQQKNAIGFALALFSVALDLLERRER